MDIAKKYQKLTPVEHILKRPSMYIGGVEEGENTVFILQNNRITEKTILYPPGLYKIFDEVIVNAYDQTIRDQTLSNIKVDIDQSKNTITVFNDGKGIDVVLHPKENIYVPELIFSHLLTSTTFDDKGKPRITGGVHGLGAKLTAIFSTYFKVEVGDSVHKKKFVQYYKKNLSFKSKPIISEYNKSKGYVKITFQPDLRYFKLKDISDDLINLFKRRVYDISALTKPNVRVSLNGVKLSVNKFEDYVSMFTESPQIKEICNNKIAEFKHGRWNIIVTKSNGKFNQVSFVNGIYTSNGGYHVTYITNKIVKEVKKVVKTKMIKDQFIKDQIWIFIASVIENPSFSSQSKEELITPPINFGSICELSSGFPKKLFTTLGLKDIIAQHIKSLQNLELSKLKIKKRPTVKGIPKLHDANYAGTKKSRDCTLILTEGDSAKTMAISGLSAIPKSGNTYGVFPLKGKLLNVREASHKQIMKNQEFINLKKIMGLSVNKVYTEDIISELRYGSILLMMDADVDGSHIKGLFINMIEFYWPSLLKIRGFIRIFVTPVVKVTKGSIQNSFFALDNYEKWKEITKDSKSYKIKYYKGLGTNTSDEAKEYFSNLDKHIVDMEWIDNSSTSIRLAFEKKRADERKQWLKNYDRSVTLDYDVKSITYKEFINKELIHFSNYDNIRSIPNIVDGLKPSQRKVLYGCLKRDLKNEIKVAQLVGYISEQTAYHHGETSLANTIIGMAQNFIASNNINLLVPKGQFGCIDPKTPVLMWDGTIKKAKEIKINDKLIGDDGKIRTVSKITSGIDDMYEIENGCMDNYIVNSSHIITIYYSGHKSIFWKESTKSWNMNYFDKTSKNVKCKSFRTNLTTDNNHYNASKLSKEQAFKKITEFAKKIPDDNIFDINIQDYIKLPKYAKYKIKGILNSKVVRWKKQNIDIDPYILGLWLGYGMSDCHAFSSEDEEIIKYWVIWLDKIGCEVVHCENYKGHDSYTYYIRRRGSKRNNNYAIGNINHNCKNCKGCLTSKRKLSICNWTYDKMQNDYKCDGLNVKGHHSINLNPFKELFKKNNLYKNKHVPKEYIINSKKNRLELLAGMIDSYGTLCKQGRTYRYEIFQNIERKNLIESFRIIAGSLGYRAKVYKYDKMLTLSISGYGLENIPTRVPRKQLDKNIISRNPIIHNIKVKYIGKGEFCGWNIDRNERFLLGDFTITHNSRLQGGRDHSSPRYIFTLLENITRFIFKKEDDNILNYLNDDGISIEPDYYVPIIPTILVNGTEGIGTGYSTFVPKFNPKDIIENLENMIKGNKFKNMIPWYKGFTGKIMEIDKGIFISKGIYKKERDNTILVTELPIGVWTENYKIMLQKMIEESKIRIISNFNNNSNESIVDISIKFLDSNYLDRLEKTIYKEDKFSINGIEKLLNLTTKINLNNMHLYNSNIKIQKYDVKGIMEEFYKVRLDFYDKRKKYQIEKLEDELKVIKSKVKFIELVVNKRISLFNKSKEQIIKILDQNKLLKLANEPPYDYLIRMNFYNLTKEKIEELKRIYSDKNKQYNILKNTKIEDIWLSDLYDLKKLI